jgi:hypothetical protein
MALDGLALPPTLLGLADAVDRIEARFAAVHESAFGTKQTC